MALSPYVQGDTNSREVQILFEHCRSLLGRVSNAIRGLPIRLGLPSP